MRAAIVRALTQGSHTKKQLEKELEQYDVLKVIPQLNAVLEEGLVVEKSTYQLP